MAKKNKTNKSVKKRIKITANDKLTHAKVGRRHLNAHMNTKRKRNLRKDATVEGRPSIIKKYKIALGIG